MVFDIAQLEQTGAAEKPEAALVRDLGDIHWDRSPSSLEVEASPLFQGFCGDSPISIWLRLAEIGRSSSS